MNDLMESLFIFLPGQVIDKVRSCAGFNQQNRQVSTGGGKGSFRQISYSSYVPPYTSAEQDMAGFLKIWC